LFELAGIGTAVSNGKMSCPVERTQQKIAVNFGVNQVSHVLFGKPPNIEFDQRSTQYSMNSSFAWTADIMNHALL